MSRSILCLICAALLFAGCKKDEGGPTDPQASAAETDAAEVVALALAAPSNGAVIHVAEAVTIARSGVLGKSTAEAPVARPLFDTTVVRRDSTQWGKYNYTVHLSYQFSNARNKLDLSYSGYGTVDLARIASTDTASSVITIDHITDPDTTYLVNSTSARSGTTTFKTRDLTVYGQCTVTLTNVRIAKSSNHVIGGSGTVAGTLRDSNGRTTVYSGTLIMMDTYQAALLMNGKRFILNLLAGTVTPG